MKKINSKKKKKDNKGVGFIDNLSVKRKMYFNAILVFILTTIMGILTIASFVGIKQQAIVVQDKADNLLVSAESMTEKINDIRISMYECISLGFSTDMKERNSKLSGLGYSIDTLKAAATEFYNENVVLYPDENSQGRANLEEFRVDVEDFIQLAKDVRTSVGNGQSTNALKILDENSDVVDEMENIVISTEKSALSTVSDNIKDINNSVSTSIVVICVALVIIIALSIIIARIISNKLGRAMERLNENVKHFSVGDFDKLTTSKAKDEMGEITRNLFDVSETLSTMVDGVKEANSKYDNGDINPQINTSTYNGAYKDLTNAVNEILNSNETKINYIIDVINSIAEGTFDLERTDFPGEQRAITDSIYVCLDNILEVRNKINYIASNANEGRFVEVETNGFENDWLDILVSLNNLVEIIEVPVTELNDVLEDMAKGELSTKIQGNYKGIFDDMKKNVNTSISTVETTINNVRSSLKRIADNDLNFAIYEEYNGDFNAIQISINSILDSLNGVFNDLTQSSDSVAKISDTLSSTSVNIANGATQQAATIEELNMTIETISEKIRNNADKSVIAKDIANDFRGNAIRGDEEMHTMLKSMEDIKNASDNIANIIKVIDDIAFQTNLLALNAAVEAARAGQHGKGFAIVAEEVRTLAGKSKEAASQTADLINESLEKVKLGNSMANSTANTLSQIVDDVTKVSTLLDEISSSSEEQADSIQEIVSNLTTFETVVQNNTLESEESAQSAKKLTEQAGVLKGLINEFELSKN